MKKLNDLRQEMGLTPKNRPTLVQDVRFSITLNLPEAQARQLVAMCEEEQVSYAIIAKRAFLQYLATKEAQP